jgi:hypothetical protein
MGKVNWGSGVQILDRVTSDEITKTHSGEDFK